MKPFAAIVTLVISAAMLSTPALSSAKDLKDEIREVIKNNPSIIADVIKENPVLIMEALQDASQNARAVMEAQREKREQEKFEAAFKNPLTPTIRKDEAIRGNKNGPITLVEYSDFQCPYCARGNETVQALLKKYKGKIRFIYKHLPLSFHAQARLTSQYYEAVRMQSDELAFTFHDNIFKDIGKLKEGEKYLESVAKASGVNMSKLKSTLKNKKAEIDARINEDMAEASKFGMQGTPGFLVNGVPVRGAYPIAHFDMIINKLQELNLVKL